MSFDVPSVREHLDAGLGELSLELDGSARAAMVDFLGTLHRWNQRFNLTAVRDPKEMVVRHLLDSLVIVPYLRGDRIVDVGTGAGLPGIPLAIAEPARHFVLLDPSAKRTRFVSHVVGALGLRNVRVEKNRAEDYRDEAGFDTVVSRALGSLNKIIQLSGHLCARKGCILAMKGRYPEQELREVDPAWRVRQTQELAVPGLSGQRHIVELTRA